MSISQVDFIAYALLLKMPQCGDMTQIENFLIGQENLTQTCWVSVNSQKDSWDIVPKKCSSIDFCHRRPCKRIEWWWEVGCKMFIWGNVSDLGGEKRRNTNIFGEYRVALWGHFAFSGCVDTALFLSFVDLHFCCVVVNDVSFHQVERPYRIQVIWWTFSRNKYHSH